MKRKKNGEGRRQCVVTCLIRGVADGIPNGSHAWKQRRGKTVKQTQREVEIEPENKHRGEMLEIGRTDRTFNENQANRKENKSFKVREVQSKGLQIEEH